MSELTNVSLSIVTYNDLERVKNTIETLTEFSKSVNLFIYVIDNGSSDGTVRYLREHYPQVSVIDNGENVGFGKAHNEIIGRLTSKYHIVCNPDIIVDRDAVGKLCEYMDKNPSVAMATPKIMSADGTEQHLQKRRPRFKYLLAGRLPFLHKLRAEYTRENENLTEPAEIEFSTGCFFIIKTEIFKKLSGFDERFFMYFEDADISDRVRSFGKLVFYPETYVIHLWERSSSKSLKYLKIHICSMFKYFLKKKPYLKHKK